MVSAVDGVPTRAGFLGEAPRVPTDRPRDGVNVAAHRLGTSTPSGRDTGLYCGLDGQLLSVKWQKFQVVFRQADSSKDPRTAVSMPVADDRRNDPGARWHRGEVSMARAWVLRPVTAPSMRCTQSVATSPHVKPGEACKGSPPP
jgi:hypothetical protein